ncbi:hypothetical protein DEN92_24080 [Escherichia coli]|nr:hypothetical protein DEN92_24080 [Escherichia coli]
MRVLSGIWTRYGAATSQFLSVYENFPAKVRSVLLLCNRLFNNENIKKRKDLTRGILARKCHYQILSHFCSIIVLRLLTFLL